jgi:hypothetical protein
MKPRTPITTRTVGFAPRVAMIPPAAAKLSPPAFVRVDADDQRAQVRESTKRADYEGGWQKVIVPDQSNARVFSTTRRWRGIDVFIARPTFTPSATALLRVKIFAVVEGMDRVLVASGILRHNSFDPTPSTWICGARVACDRFDVEFSCNESPASPGVDAVDIGVIASDELVELPPEIGAVSLTDTPRITTDTNKAPTILTGDPGYELVSVHATAIAAARWLHIHDQDSVDPIFLTGIAPVFSFGFSAIGESVPDVSRALLRGYRFTTGLAAIASSTAGTTTPAVGDVAYQLFFR